MPARARPRRSGSTPLVTGAEGQVPVEFEHISLTRAEGIATLTIDRPSKLNALSRAAIEELGRAVQQVRDDDGVRGVILTGAGEKAFVAGADIAELSGLEPMEGRELSRRGQRVFAALEALRKPVVAAVNGFALGGGCELALACHLRVAAENARFALPEVKLGLIPGYGGTVRLPRLVGAGRALELILTGEMIDASEAHRIGLVNRVVPPGSAVDESRALLQGILRNGPLAVGMAIESVRRAAESSPEQAMGFESAIFGILTGTEDAREGSAAFLEKRPAKFRGH